MDATCGVCEDQACAGECCASNVLAPLPSIFDPKFDALAARAKSVANGGGGEGSGPVEQVIRNVTGTTGSGINDAGAMRISEARRKRVREVAAIVGGAVYQLYKRTRADAAYAGRRELAVASLGGLLLADRADDQALEAAHLLMPAVAAADCEAVLALCSTNRFLRTRSAPSTRSSGGCSRTRCSSTWRARRTLTCCSTSCCQRTRAWTVARRRRAPPTPSGIWKRAFIEACRREKEARRQSRMALARREQPVTIASVAGAPLQAMRDALDVQYGGGANAVRAGVARGVRQFLAAQQLPPVYSFLVQASLSLAGM